MSKIKKSDFVNWSIESAIKIALISIIIWISFLIFRPFLVLVLWGIIIAVAVYPIHKRLVRLVGGKGSISASLLSLVMLAVIIVPTVLFIITLVENIQDLATSFEEETFAIPPPPGTVKDWPVIGNTVHNFWALSSENLEGLLDKYSEQAGQLGKWLLSSITGIIGTLLLFVGSIIVSAIFLANSEGGYKTAVAVSTRLVGERGVMLVENSSATIRSVVQGVLGVAIIQTGLLGAGFFVADIPAASILTLIVLFLTIVQLPPTLLVIPVIIYVFSVSSTGFAVAFTIWSLLAGMSDTFLKPMMLGRGLEIPMLIILVGAIGGMMLFGIIGLFLGSVILALAYELFKSWMLPEDEYIKANLKDLSPDS
jgi:predicted PurR-regulated permease PerM